MNYRCRDRPTIGFYYPSEGHLSNRKENIYLKKKFLRKATAMILVIVSLVSMLPTTIVSAASVPAEVKGKTLSQVLGMDVDVYINWLLKHKSDDYYLGTPYKPYDHRNPLGDCNNAYGMADTKGVAAMNCTGFVWHVLYKSTKSSGGNTDIIPALSGWYSFYTNNKISRKYFSSKSDMLKSGYLDKGDIVWMFHGSETSVSDYHHIGIYMGDGKSDVLWHSIDKAGNEKGNVLTTITPKSSTPLYVVIKTGVPKIKLQLQKSTANSNLDYSLKGAKYNIYTDSSCSKSSYFGSITTDENGFGKYGTGTNGKSIPIDTFYCKEVTAPKGYALDTKVYQFKKTTSKADGVYIYKAAVSDVPYIKLQLLKSSANPDITDGNNNYSLKGAVYTVYTDKACTKEAGMTLKTNALGYSCYKTGDGTNTDKKDKDITALYKKNSGQSVALKKGVTYYCTETEAPPGYELDDTVYQFKDSGSVSSDGVKIYRAYSITDNAQPKDNPINDPVGIVLQKRNAVTGETINQGLEGAIFQIQYYATEIDKDYDVESGETAPTLDTSTLKRTWYIKTNDLGRTRLADEFIVDNDSYLSDEFYYQDGFVTIPIGTVVIREVEAPSGYFKSDTVFYRLISEEIADLSQDTNTPIEVPIDEQPASGYIGIHKMNNSRKGVAGATYGLYAEATATTLLSTIVTDSNGKGVFNYLAGVNKTFYIKEITAPAGYPLDTTVYPVTPTEENTTVSTAVIQTIYEESIKGNILIKKSSNDGIVANMWFAITDNLGNEYNAVATDSKGEALITGLPLYDENGNKIKYTVKELGFKTTPGEKSYGRFTWTVKAENCIYYKGAYYEGVANNTFSDCEYAYSRYYYGDKDTAIKNAAGYTNTLVANSTVTYSFVNTVPETDIEVYKDSYDGTKYGFYFRVKDQYGHSYGEIRTNNNGYASYKSTYTKGLLSCIKVPNSGICLKLSYQVEELGFLNPGSSGEYYLPETYKDKYVSNLTPANVDDNSIIFKAYNYPDTGEVNIIKSSDDNDIANLYFKISALEDNTEFGGDMTPTVLGYDLNGYPLTSIIVKTDTDGKATSNSVELYDKNGILMDGLLVYVQGQTDFNITYKIDELGFDNGDGTYSLPDRYKPNESIIFNLLDNRSYTYECHNSTIEPGQLQVIKTSEDDVVYNFWFKITSTAGLDINVVTDESGYTTVLDNLPIYMPATQGTNELVKYRITELGIENEDGTYSIPYRYKAPQSQTITLDTTGNIISVSFKNTLKTGSVTLKKVNCSGTSLTGSQWELYKTDDTLVNLIQTGNGSYYPSSTGSISTLSTDSNGKLYVYSLPQGDYYFVEKQSPTGTMPYGGKIPFTISGDSNETLFRELTVPNHRIFMYNTGGDGNFIFFVLSALMLFIAVITLILYKLKNNKRKRSKFMKKHFSKAIVSIMIVMTLIFTTIPFASAATAIDSSKKVSISLKCDKPGYTFTLYKVGTLSSTTESPYETKYTSLVPEIDASVLSGDSAAALKTLDATTIPSSAPSQGTWTTSATSTTKTFSNLTQGIYYVKATNYPAGVKSVTNSIVALPYYNNNTWVYSVDTIDLASKVADGDVETGKTITNSTKNNVNYTDVSLGDTVNFEIKSTVAGSSEMKLKSYAVYDDMSKGLTLNKDSFNVSLLKADGTEITELDKSEYIVTITSEGDGENTVFDVALTNAYLQTEEFYASDVYYTSVTYSAVLNKHAVVGKAGNPNTETKLEYSNKNGVKSEVEGNTVYVYTYAVKIDKINENGAALVGAKFSLYKTEADALSNKNAIASGTSNSNGLVKFYNTTGEEMKLSSGTYFAYETSAPSGYVVYGKAIQIDIDVTYGTTFVNGSYVTNQPEKGYASMKVKNTKTMLPETGDIGNIVFILLSASCVIIGITLLAVSKNMKKNK